MTIPVLCIGVANVDVIAHVDTGFLVLNRIDKGTSTLIRSSDVTQMIETLSDPVFIPGGCAANTACGLGQMDVPTAFIGMINDDAYGHIFKNGFKPYNVVFHPGFAQGKRTSLCLTLVTQDKERSFVFSPDAASWFLSESNLPDHDPEKQLIVYTEANLFRMTSGTSRQSMVHAVVDKYSGPNVQIILNLIDTDITIHQRQAIRTMIDEKRLSCVICNAEELAALFDTDSFESALLSAKALDQTFITTMGKDGAMLVQNHNVIRIEPYFVAHEDIEDLIGAGDQFAAGFIAGIANRKTILDACRQGALKASEIILVPGARPKTA